MCDKENNYLGKCEELDDLLKRHFSHKDSKLRKAEKKLEEERRRSAYLNNLIKSLQAELEEMRNSQTRERDLQRNMWNSDLTTAFSLLTEKECELKRQFFQLHEKEISLLQLQNKIVETQKRLAVEVELARDQVERSVLSVRAADVSRSRLIESSEIMERHSAELTASTLLENQTLQLFLEEEKHRGSLLCLERDCYGAVCNSLFSSFAKLNNDVERENLELRHTVDEYASREKKDRLKRLEEKKDVENRTKLLEKQKEEFAEEVDSILREVQSLMAEVRHPQLSAPELYALEGARDVLSQFCNTLP